MLSLILAAFLQVTDHSAAAQSRPATEQEEIGSAIRRGLELILAAQERYVPEADRNARSRGRAPAPVSKADSEKGVKDASAEKAAEAARSRPAPAEKGGKAEPAKAGLDGAAARELPASRPLPSEWPYEGVYRLPTGEVPPGYRVGGTAITCQVLLEIPGFREDPRRRAAFDRGVAFVMDELEQNPLLQSGFLGNYDVRGWAHTYGLLLLLRCIDLHPLDADSETRALRLCERLVKTLEETEIVRNGGWNYARSKGGDQPAQPSTFMTAPTLQALFAAKAHGIVADKLVVERALKTLVDARLFETGAFQYATNAGKQTGQGFEAVAGACARMAVCETTLQLAGRGSVDRIRRAVAAFFENWEELEKRRKQPLTHLPPYMIAPYYFHYAHTYAAQAIEQLPAAEREPLRNKLRDLYWKTREPDGGWNDRVFPRSMSFGTSMAILGLLMPELPPPATW